MLDARRLRRCSIAEVRDDIFPEQVDRVHGLLMRNRPELHHREELIELRFLLNALELLDRSIGTAADAHP